MKTELLCFCRETESITLLFLECRRLMVLCRGFRVVVSFNTELQ